MFQHSQGVQDAEGSRDRLVARAEARKPRAVAGLSPWLRAGTVRRDVSEIVRVKDLPARQTEDISMAKHKVTFELPIRELGSSDVKFRIKRDGEMFGTLAISNGSVVWFPKSTSKGHQMGWKRFDELMKTEAKQVERR